MSGKTITKENARTKSEIAILIYAHKLDGFHEFCSLVEEMLDRYKIIATSNPTPPCKECDSKNTYEAESFPSTNREYRTITYVCRDCGYSFTGDTLC